MLFNSFGYAVFLPVVFILYWFLPHRFRWVLLLIASYYFYMSWNPKYLVLILFTTGVSYLAARLIENRRTNKEKNLILAACAILCLGVLFVFKYFNFFMESATTFFQMFAIELHPVLLKFMLPVGISFYTFQTLSYVIDVYRGKVKAEHHFGYYAVFISFFPQLVAGPIERTENLLPQIKEKHCFHYDEASYGLKLMAWGFFKKLVIADTISPYLNTIFGNVREYSGFVFIISAGFFAFQVYCDFSGYSDIAIGTARLLDIHLMKNFNSPFFSQSIRECWGRWHISLSTWFKDYVYIPLGGSRKGELRYAINMLVTFLVSGLWHGARWTYVIWGGLNGLGQVIERIFLPFTRKKSRGIVRWIRYAIVFTFFSASSVFFACHSVGDAIYSLFHSFYGIANLSDYIKIGITSFGMGTFGFLKILAMMFLLCVFDYFSLTRDVILELSKKKAVFRWTAYIFLGLIIVFFSQKGVAAEFVYFQF